MTMLIDQLQPRYDARLTHHADYVHVEEAGGEIAAAMAGPCGGSGSRSCHCPIATASCTPTHVGR